MKELSFYSGKLRNLTEPRNQENEVLKRIVRKQSICEQFANHPEVESWQNRVEEVGEAYYTLIGNPDPAMCLEPKLNLTYVGEEKCPLIEFTVSELEYYGWNALSFEYDNVFCTDELSRLLDYDDFKLEFYSITNRTEWKSRVKGCGNQAYFIIDRRKGHRDMPSASMVLVEVGQDRLPTIEFRISRTFY